MARSQYIASKNCLGTLCAFLKFQVKSSKKTILCQVRQDIQKRGKIIMTNKTTNTTNDTIKTVSIFELISKVDGLDIYDVTAVNKAQFKAFQSLNLAKVVEPQFCIAIKNTVVCEELNRQLATDKEMIDKLNKELAELNDELEKLELNEKTTGSDKTAERAPILVRVIKVEDALSQLKNKYNSIKSTLELASKEFSDSDLVKVDTLDDKSKLKIELLRTMLTGNSDSLYPYFESMIKSASKWRTYKGASNREDKKLNELYNTYKSELLTLADVFSINKKEESSGVFTTRKISFKAREVENIADYVSGFELKQDKHGDLKLSGIKDSKKFSKLVVKILIAKLQDVKFTTDGE